MTSVWLDCLPESLTTEAGAHHFPIQAEQPGADGSRVGHLAIVTHSSCPLVPQEAEVCSVSSSELPRKGEMS